MMISIRYQKVIAEYSPREVGDTGGKVLFHQTIQALPAGSQRLVWKLYMHGMNCIYNFQVLYLSGDALDCNEYKKQFA